jgi:hypothetical protein
MRRSAGTILPSWAAMLSTLFNASAAATRTNAPFENIIPRFSFSIFFYFAVKRAIDVATHHSLFFSLQPDFPGLI